MPVPFGPIRPCLSLSASTDASSLDTYTLSLHDALPISRSANKSGSSSSRGSREATPHWTIRSSRWQPAGWTRSKRSEEHTSELQSRQYLVCRLLLEKKNDNNMLDPDEGVAMSYADRIEH